MSPRLATLVSQAVGALIGPKDSVNWLNKLPGFKRSAPGLEWALWKKLPWITLAGTLLPMTWVVMGMKACMFHAFDGDWQTPMWVTLGWGVASASVACAVGTWRFVPLRRIRPMLDV